MDFMLSPKDKAQKYWLGFLVKTMIECEQKFSWLKFTIAGKHLKGTGSLKNNEREYKFTILYSPFFKSRFDRITVETKGLKKSFATHFNGDGTLCLYHAIKDLQGRPFLELVDIIPWISEWVYGYEKFLEYNVWIMPEHSHNIS